MSRHVRRLRRVLGALRGGKRFYEKAGMSVRQAPPVHSIRHLLIVSVIFGAFKLTIRLDFGHVRPQWGSVDRADVDLRAVVHDGARVIGDYPAFGAVFGGDFGNGFASGGVALPAVQGGDHGLASLGTIARLSRSA
jgi:hypothetical protein